MLPIAIKDVTVSGLQRTKALSLESSSVAPVPLTLPCKQPLTVVGPSTEILFAAIDAPRATAGLVASLGGAGLRGVAGSARQE